MDLAVGSEILKTLLGEKKTRLLVKRHFCYSGIPASIEPPCEATTHFSSIATAACQIWYHGAVSYTARDLRVMSMTQVPSTAEAVRRFNNPGNFAGPLSNACKVDISKVLRD